ncbi:unnamed protein product, partial [Owenia fusiformis]
SPSKMAKILRNNKHVVCISGKYVNIFNLGDENQRTLCCDPTDLKDTQRETDDAKTEEEKPEKSESDGEDGEKSKNGTAKGSKCTSGSDAILTCGFSSTGRYFAVCDDHKRLTLWDATEDWKQLSVRTVLRRSSTLTFSQKEDNVIIGDKSGDVFTFSTKNCEQPGQLILGHLSLLLDTIVTKNDEFIITSDKDEKIRVSRYPNGYTIESYCLGHTQYVTALCYVEDVDLLISGAGDSTIRGWSYKQGEELCCIDCRNDLELEAQPDEKENTDGLVVKSLKYSSKHNLLAVGIYKHSKILIYKIDATSSPQLQFHQAIQTPENVLELCFDEEGYLWVLMGEESRSVQVYQITEQSICELLKEEHCTTDSNKETLRTVAYINTQEDILKKSSLEPENLFEHLHKLKVGSKTFMSEYYDKKEKRIETEKEKYKQNQQKRQQRRRGGKRSNKNRETEDTTEVELSEKKAKSEMS